MQELARFGGTNFRQFCYRFIFSAVVASFFATSATATTSKADLLAPPVSSPTISSISPSSYPADNNNHAMTIFGANFQNGAALTFHDPQGNTYHSVASKLTFISSSQINYLFNDGSDAGTWNVAVNNPDGGNSAPANFSVGTSSPTISSISPSSYPADNNDHAMTIFGANFQNGAALTFHDPQGNTYHSVASKLTFISSGQINYRFNDGSDAGTWNVAVNNPDGGNSAPANFTVTSVSSPTISSISPSSYPADNNDHAMTIFGANFQNGAALTFHDPQGNTYHSVASKLTFISSGQINYQFNDGSDPGTWNVAVNNPDGGNSAPANFTVTSVSSPTISSISPSSYPADNIDHAMTIYGANFQNGAALTFHDPQGNTYHSVASKLTFVSSGQINYQFNDGSDPGTWNVAVNNPDGGNSAPANFTVTSVSSPTISSISPSSYPADYNDHAMTIYGANFQNGAALTFHDPQGNTYHSNPAKLTFVNSGQIDYQFNDGSDAGTWNVAVNNPDGGNSSPANFTVTSVSSPTISSISPSSYPADNYKHLMAIYGANFENGAALTFHDPQGDAIKSNPANLTFVNSGQINYQFNDHADAGTWNVAVNNPDGGNSSPVNFEVGSGNTAFSWPVVNPNLPIDNGYDSYNKIGNYKYHTGLDITSSSQNLAIFAAADGTARIIPLGMYPNQNHCMGNIVVLDHNGGKGLFSVYAHLAKIEVQNGWVPKGTRIATMGKTGGGGKCSPIPAVHLHFELKLRNAEGNLTDDQGPAWGYTPPKLGLPDVHPSLYGYVDPMPYLQYPVNGFSSPVSVVASSDQAVRTGPDTSVTTTTFATISAGQKFSAFASNNDWYEIFVASGRAGTIDGGPASGWIQATTALAETQLEIVDPQEAITGITVRSGPSTTGTTKLSLVWDKQWFVQLAIAAAGNGCTSVTGTPLPWYEIALASNASSPTGWICGAYVIQHTAGAPRSIHKATERVAERPDAIRPTKVAEPNGTGNSPRTDTVREHVLLALLWPVQNASNYRAVIEPYRMYFDVGRTAGRYSTGITIGAARGTPIASAANGNVVSFTRGGAGKGYGYGNTVVVAHGGGVYTLYGGLADLQSQLQNEIGTRCHSSDQVTFKCDSGQVPVTSGQQLGSAGEVILNNGHTMGVRFEVRAFAALGAPGVHPPEFGYTSAIPDALGYHDPIEYLQGAVRVKRPTRVNVTTGGSFTSLRIGPSDQYPALAALREKEEYWVRMTASATPDCSLGWYEVYRGPADDPVYPPSTPLAYITTREGKTPTAWACRGNNGTTYVTQVQ